MHIFGQYILFLKSLFQNRESFKTYFKLTMEECVSIGFNSLVLIMIVSTFIGAVSTIQTAYNLISPMVPKTVISKIIRDMTMLEMAPSILALVFAGKVGSNIAGEIGTMRITEQIDALEVMGVNSASYLVLPKILASVITYPILVIIAIFLSIFGGYVAGVYTGIVTDTDYIIGLRNDFLPYNLFFAIIKSFAFAFLVSSISAFQGYYTTGGAYEVGKASTKAVTNSCIAILLADYSLAKLLLPV